MLVLGRKNKESVVIIASDMVHRTAKRKVPLRDRMRISDRKKIRIDCQVRQMNRDADW